MVEILDLSAKDLEMIFFEANLPTTYDGKWAKWDFALFFQSETIHYNISSARVYHVNFLRGVADEGFHANYDFRKKPSFLCLKFS